MPTTDNMRVSVTKKNFSITYTTRWDDAKVITIAMTSSAIGGGHARAVDITVTSANASGNLGVTCARFAAIIDTDIGTGEDGWLGGYAVYGYLNVTADGIITGKWFYGVYAKVEINAEASLTSGAFMAVHAEVMPNASGFDVVYGVGAVNNGTETGTSAYYINGLWSYVLRIGATGAHCATTGDISGLPKGGWLKVRIGTHDRYVQLYYTS